MSAAPSPLSAYTDATGSSPIGNAHSPLPYTCKDCQNLSIASNHIDETHAREAITHTAQQGQRNTTQHHDETPISSIESIGSFSMLDTTTSEGTNNKSEIQENVPHYQAKDSMETESDIRRSKSASPTTSAAKSPKASASRSHVVADDNKGNTSAVEHSSSNSLSISGTSFSFPSTSMSSGAGPPGTHDSLEQPSSVMTYQESFEKSPIDTIPSLSPSPLQGKSDDVISSDNLPRSRSRSKSPQLKVDTNRVQKPASKVTAAPAGQPIPAQADNVSPPQQAMIARDHNVSTRKRASPRNINQSGRNGTPTFLTASPSIAPKRSASPSPSPHTEQKASPQHTAETSPSAPRSAFQESGHEDSVGQAFSMPQYSTVSSSHLLDLTHDFSGDEHLHDFSGSSEGPTLQRDPKISSTRQPSPRRATRTDPTTPKTSKIPIAKKPFYPASVSPKKRNTSVSPQKKEAERRPVSNSDKKAALSRTNQKYATAVQAPPAKDPAMEHNELLIRGYMEENMRLLAENKALHKQNTFDQEKENLRKEVIRLGNIFSNVGGEEGLQNILKSFSTQQTEDKVLGQREQEIMNTVREHEKTARAMQRERLELFDTIASLRAELQRTQTAQAETHAKERSQTEFAEQEQLLRGYQAENMRLIAEVKSLRKGREVDDEKEELRKEVIRLANQFESIGGEEGFHTMLEKFGNIKIAEKAYLENQTAFTSTLKQHEQMVKQLHSERSRLLDTVADMTAEISRYKSTAEQTRKEAQELLIQQDTLEKEIFDKGLEVQRLAKHVESLQAQLSEGSLQERPPAKIAEVIPAEEAKPLPRSISRDDIDELFLNIELLEREVEEAKGQTSDAVLRMEESQMQLAKFREEYELAIAQKLALQTELGELQEQNSQIPILQGEIATTRKEVESLNLQIAIADARQTAIHETTMSLLSKTQVKSAKENERMLKSIMDREHNDWATEEINRWRNKVNECDRIERELRGELRTIEKEVNQWRGVLISIGIEIRSDDGPPSAEDIRRMWENLKVDNARLEKELVVARAGHSPTMQQIESIFTKLSRLEEGLNRRDRDLREMLSSHSGLGLDGENEELKEQIRKWQTKYDAMLNKKNLEIRKFQTEVDDFARVLKSMKDADHGLR